MERIYRRLTQMLLKFLIENRDITRHIRESMLEEKMDEQIAIVVGLLTEIERMHKMNTGGGEKNGISKKSEPQ